MSTKQTSTGLLSEWPSTVEEPHGYHQPTCFRDVHQQSDSAAALCIKTRMCRFFQQQRCSRGANCLFAHHESEIRSPPNLAKTKLCAKWRRGTCALGERCTYAHGVEDLRPLSDSSVYLEHKLRATPCPRMMIKGACEIRRCPLNHDTRLLASTSSEPVKVQPTPFRFPQKITATSATISTPTLDTKNLVGSVKTQRPSSVVTTSFCPERVERSSSSAGSSSVCEEDRTTLTKHYNGKNTQNTLPFLQIQPQLFLRQIRKLLTGIMQRCLSRPGQACHVELACKCQESLTLLDSNCNSFLRQVYPHLSTDVTLDRRRVSVQPIVSKSNGRGEDEMVEDEHPDSSMTPLLIVRDTLSLKQINETILAPVASFQSPRAIVIRHVRDLTQQHGSTNNNLHASMVVFINFLSASPVRDIVWQNSTFCTPFAFKGCVSDPAPWVAFLEELQILIAFSLANQEPLLLFEAVSDAILPLANLVSDNIQNLPPFPGEVSDNIQNLRPFPGEIIENSPFSGPKSYPQISSEIPICCPNTTPTCGLEPPMSSPQRNPADFLGRSPPLDEIRWVWEQAGLEEEGLLREKGGNLSFHSGVSNPNWSSGPSPSPQYSRSLPMRRVASYEEAAGENEEEETEMVASYAQSRKKEVEHLLLLEENSTVSPTTLTSSSPSSSCMIPNKYYDPPEGGQRAPPSKMISISSLLPLFSRNLNDFLEDPSVQCVSPPFFQDAPY